MLDLAPDFDEFFASLTEHHVEFVVVGAYALAVHGRPRDNAARLLSALTAFGFPTPQLTAEGIVDPARMIHSASSRCKST